MLAWSSLPGTPGVCAILPDGRVAHVSPARWGTGWIAKVCRRAGATPSAFVPKPSEAEARGWVERLAEELARRSA